jgi:hypothetical protein
MDQPGSPRRLGASILLSAWFSLDETPPYPLCPQILALEAYPPGGEPFTIGIDALADPAYKDTPYQLSYTPDLPGDWDFRARVNWGSEGQGLPERTIYRSDPVTVRILRAPYAEAAVAERSADAAGVPTEGDTALETPTATADTGDVGASTTADPRDATSGAQDSTPEAKAGEREATSGADEGAATAGLPTTTKVGGLEARSVDATLPSRSTTAGAEEGE